MKFFSRHFFRKHAPESEHFRFVIAKAISHERPPPHPMPKLPYRTIRAAPQPPSWSFRGLQALITLAFILNFSKFVRHHISALLI